MIKTIKTSNVTLTTVFTGAWTSQIQFPSWHKILSFFILSSHTHTLRSSKSSSTQVFWGICVHFLFAPCMQRVYHIPCTQYWKAWITVLSAHLPCHATCSGLRQTSSEHCNHSLLQSVQIQGALWGDASVLETPPVLQQNHGDWYNVWHVMLYSGISQCI